MYISTCSEVFFNKLQSLDFLVLQMSCMNDLYKNLSTGSCTCDLSNSWFQSLSKSLADLRVCACNQLGKASFGCTSAAIVL